MRIRGITIPPLITHVFVFLFGTVVVIPWESDCELDMQGILLSPGPSLEKRLDAFDERAGLSILARDQGQLCRITDQPLYVWRDPVSKRNYIHTERAVGAVRIIEHLVARRSVELTDRGADYPACQRLPQVTYGF